VRAFLFVSGGGGERECECECVCKCVLCVYVVCVCVLLHGLLFIFYQATQSHQHATQHSGAVSATQCECGGGA
jgi:hypothetical protein